MNKFLSVCCLCLCCLLCTGAEDISSAENQVNDLVKKESDIELSVANCKPDKRITRLMGEIDKIAQSLMTADPSDAGIALSEKCLAVLSALRERRVYSYMLWAEYMLEESSSGKYKDLSALNQITLMALYCKLSEIDISIIRENMLNREIMTRLAEIYDRLEPENKRRVRVNAVILQRDQLSIIDSIPSRKTLDDF